ncbi:hypothetical protein OG783_33565 (plasmid) [Streptomyces jietaisiensis]|uniref:hypothetical protein n=1 Tax=Streptomyces griseoaurantiacus TaxID=68213 RepID=UPI002F909DE1
MKIRDHPHGKGRPGGSAVRQQPAEVPVFGRAVLGFDDDAPPGLVPGGDARPDSAAYAPSQGPAPARSVALALRTTVGAHEQ